MADFNPDQFLAETAPRASGFDPDKFLSETAPTGSKTTDILPTIVDKAAQGAAIFTPQISGGAEALGRMAGVQGLGGKIKDIGLAPDGPTIDPDTLAKAYADARDKDRANAEQESKDHPLISGASEIAGAVVSPATKLFPGMGVAKTGALLGGAQGLANSKSDDVSGKAADALIGSALGYGAGAGMEAAAPYLAKGATAIGGKLADAADNLGARAIGAERGTIKKFGMDKIRQAAQFAADNGIITGFGSTEDKVAANEAAKTSAMNDRAAAYDQIDKAGASTFNPIQVAKDAVNKILEGKNLAHDDTQELVEALKPHISNILSRGEDNISMSEAQNLVEALGKKAKFDTSRSTMQNQVAKDVYNSVRQSINQSAGEAADNLGTPGLREAIEAANQKYAAGKTVSTLLQNKQAAEQGNKLMGGLTDTIMGAGVLAHPTPYTAAAFAAKKYGEKYGAQQGSILLSKISDSLLESPEMLNLAQKSPAAFQNIVQKIAPHLEGASAGSLPAAASGDQNNQANAPAPKGMQKFANDGLNKLVEHANDPDVENALNDSKAKLMKDPTSVRLLAAASDLKPGSKAMENIMQKIKSRVGGDE